MLSVCLCHCVCDPPGNYHLLSYITIFMDSWLFLQGLNLVNVGISLHLSILPSTDTGSSQKVLTRILKGKEGLKERRGRERRKFFTETCNKLLRKTGIIPVSHRRPSNPEGWLMFMMWHFPTLEDSEFGHFCVLNCAFQKVRLRS